MTLNRGGVQFPGNINMAGDRGGSFPGATVTFIAGEGEGLAKAMGEFFNAPDMGLVTYIREVPVPGGMLVYWTKHLDDEELALFDETNREIQEKMRLWREERQKAKDTEREKREALAKEQERLAVVGKRCEENHGHLVKEARKLKSVKGAK